MGRYPNYPNNPKITLITLLNNSDNPLPLGGTKEKSTPFSLAMLVSGVVRVGLVGLVSRVIYIGCLLGL